MELELLRLEERLRTGIDLGESHFREFKSAFERDAAGNAKLRDPKEICKDIGEVLVAFANADGGELLVGVEDDGRITGVGHKQELISAFERAVKTHVHVGTPLPSPVVRQTEQQGQKILYFCVSKSTTCIHLTSDGRCLQRFDKENRPAPVEQIQYERREQRSREYDRAYVDGAGMKDLNISSIDSVAKQIAQGYSPEKLLQFLALAEYGPDGLRLRRAALLLFAKDVSRWHPRCEVRILRVRGTELGVGEKYNVVQDDTVKGNIILILESAWETLRPHLARTRFHSDALFRETIMYPEVACREALVNAVAHRDYSIEGLPIEILVFDDRLEIKSPGTLLATVSLDALKNLKRPHESRNVMIARVLKELGYMREMGEGVGRIFYTMREFDLIDPEFKVESDSFSVNLHHKSVFSPKDLEWLRGYSDFDLTKNEQRVVLLGRDGHFLSTNEIIKTTGIIDTEDFRALYENMNRRGIIYNAKPQIRAGGGRRREIGRFRVRPPQETQQYLEEILVAIAKMGQISELSMDGERAIRGLLSKNSPFFRNLVKSLQALGFLDVQRRLLPKSRILPPKTKSEDGEPTSWKRGTLKSKKLDGYGFIGCDDGNEYFVHASSLLPPLIWDGLKEGMGLLFKVGERQIAGKPRPAVQVKIET